MKKYLLIMLLLIPIKINAEILLTDYYLKESNIKEYKEETEYLKRTEIIKYNNGNDKDNEVCLSRNHWTSAWDSFHLFSTCRSILSNGFSFRL